MSFVSLGGRCAGCRGQISWQYPLVELASGLSAVLALLVTMDLVRAVLLTLVFWLLLLIAVIDAKHQLIPDALSIPLIVTAAIFAQVNGTLALIPALIGGAFFGLQWIVSRGKWIGTGDIFLGVAMGFLLGTWQLITLALMTAYITGAAWACVLLLRRRTGMNDALAFGPFLCAATGLTVVFGPALLLRLFAL